MALPITKTLSAHNALNQTAAVNNGLFALLMACVITTKGDLWKEKKN
jgi:hypothetical protein